MRKGRRGIKILGTMLLAALSLMAISASAALAEGSEGHFLILKTEGGETTETGTVAGSTAATGKLLVPGLGLTVECTGGTATGTLEAAGIAKAVVSFTGCKVFENKFCKVYPTATDMKNKTNAGTATATGLGLLHLHNAKHYLIVHGLPIAGEPGKFQPFTNLYFSSAADGCTLPLENVVKGLVAFLLPNALEHLLNQPIDPLTAEDELLLNGTGAGQLNLGVKLFYGEEPAALDPALISNAHLTGANEGKKWGAL